MSVFYKEWNMTCLIGVLGDGVYIHSVKKEECMIVH